MRGLVFLLLYTSMLPIAIMAAHLGIIFYIWASLIAPNVFVFGFVETIPFSKIAMGVAIAAILIDQSKKKPYLDLYHLFMIGFFLQCALTFAFSLTESSRNYDVADRIWKIALLCLLMGPALRGRLQIHTAVLVISIAMGVQGGMEGLKYLISGAGHKMVPPANFGDNNSFGLFILMSLPMFIYLFRYTVNPYVRLVIAGGIFINIVTIIGTNSRGAFLGIAAIAVAMIIQSRHRISTLLVVSMIGGSVLLFAPSKVIQRLDTIQTAEEDGSFLGRVRAWKLNTLVALDRPVLGGGFSSMEDPVIWSRYLPQFSRFDFIETGEPDRPRAAHSIYFQVLGDTGFSGLFLFLGILASSFVSLWRIQRMTARALELQWAYDLAGYFRLSMIALVVSGAALSVAYSDLLFIVFTLISVLRRTVQEGLDAPAGTPARPPSIANRAHRRPKLANGA